MLPTTATASAPPPPPSAGPASSPGEPPAALLLALGYMRLRELLACARACRGLREAVAGDPLLWLRLVVEPPLSHRITDEALLALTDRAQGRLRSLHLLGCPRLSDAGLLRIVQRNPDVTELFVPRCTGLTADGLVKIIHFLHGHKGNLRRIRLHGICKMTTYHLDVIKSLVCRDGRSRCQGCFFCVARCETCGGCIDLEELGESGLACSDFLCMDCWLKLPKCCTCNRPYCERHSNLKENLSSSGQFTCQECTAFATSLEGLGEGY